MGDNNTFLRGTGVALVTPFRKDGGVDFTSFDKLLDYVIEGGVDYLVVMGTTAESVTLTCEEQDAILNFVKDKVEGKLPIVLGIGGNNTQAVLQKIHDTNFTGIVALLSVAPYYNKPTQEGIFCHYQAIANASPVPVILYNVPGRTGVNINAETTLRLSGHKNIKAVKEASGNLSQIMKILAEKPTDFVVVSGDDALAFPIISLGGSGVISVIANALPREYSQLVHHALSGELEEARKIQYQMLDLMGAIFEEGNPAGVKSILSQKGLIENCLRLPLVSSTQTLDKKIGDFLKKI